MAIIAPKGPKKLERHFKGVANHRRVQILLLIEILVAHEGAGRS